MNSQYLKRAKLPSCSGIYIFHDLKNRPIYVGRATSLKDRVKSYFTNDLYETRGPRIVDMVIRAKSLTYEKTDSVLEAVILETNLIKKYQPKYNVDEKDDKSSTFIIITKEDWPRVFTVRERDWQKSDIKSLSYKVKKVFGPYPHAGLANESLKIIRKIFPFRDKKAHDSRHELFYRSIGRSPNTETDSARLNYLKTVDNIIKFLKGHKRILIRQLTSEMNSFAKRMLFEDANRIKRTLYALKHINDIALIKKQNETYSAARNLIKIEAYDIAHLSGTNAVGCMVASVNGEFQPKEYRTFKMSQDVNNDLKNLKELISRRLNHSEWKYPDLIVVDGDVRQKRVAEEVLSARRVDIPVVSVIKNDKHRARAILGLHNMTQSKWIIALNAEAHRFTVKYHRKRRALNAFS